MITIIITTIFYYYYFLLLLLLFVLFIIITFLLLLFFFFFAFVAPGHHQRRLKARAAGARARAARGNRLAAAFVHGAAGPHGGDARSMTGYTRVETMKNLDEFGVILYVTLFMDYTTLYILDLRGLCLVNLFLTWI